MDQSDLARRAELGDPAAQYALGQIYWRGEDVPRDVATALVWFRRAARSRSSEHVKTLGLILCSNEFGPQEFEEGFECLLAAASAGDTAAQYFVAAEYATGHSVPRNPEAAVYWYRQLAESGHAEAQYNLGIMHLEGDGVSKDFRKGRKLIQSAAEKGEYLARDFLSRAFASGMFGFPVDLEQAINWRTLADSDK